VLLSQFKSPIILLLVFATGLSFALGERTDATIIAWSGCQLGAECAGSRGQCHPPSCRREELHLEEVTADRRAPVLKAYLQRAPGARAHLPIQKDAPLAAFEQVAPQFPVFRVVARSKA
jgi:hypothetical protein